MIDAATRRLVIERAKNHCEYCRLPQSAYAATFNVDHIAAVQHGGGDDDENLALSCPKWNRKKGPNLAGIDPLTKATVLLFNPRKDLWKDHFRWNGPLLAGLTPCGRATISVLDLNADSRVELRVALIALGSFPPEI
ncbi:MAG TPA: HNH endonuclease signature motif containing protein [Tepidisphaeraceae bacterium]|nr:HNH endonuclease signature motif containing protein [Tepidisphaeraceae bacterium]